MKVKRYLRFRDGRVEHSDGDCGPWYKVQRRVVTKSGLMVLLSRQLSHQDNVLDMGVPETVLLPYEQTKVRWLPKSRRRGAISAPMINHALRDLFEPL